MSSRPSRARVTLASIIIAAAAALPLPAAAQAEKDEAFKEGLEARKKQQWPAVAAAMQRAIQEDPKEATRKVGGRIFGGTEYLPYFMLGEAYAKQNDCVGAVTAWENSLKQGVVQTRPEFFSQLQKGNAACEQKGVLLAEKFDAAVARARQQVDSAYSMMTRLKDKGNANLGTWKAQPTFEGQYQRASNEYEVARKQFGEAQRTRLDKHFGEVARVTEHVKEIVGALDSELTAAVERASRTTNAAEEVRRSLREAEKLDVEIEKSAGFLDPSLKAARADGQKAIENARQQLDPRRLSDGTVTAARASVLEATQSLQKVLDAIRTVVAKDLKKRFDQAALLAAASFSKAETELQTVKGLMERYPAKATPQVVGDFEKTQKQLGSARRKHDAAVRGQLVAGVEAAAREADTLYTGLITIEESIGVKLTLEDRGVPPWLQQGAARFLEGDYAGALDKLDDGTPPEPAVAHVLLFRAAAQYALFVRSNQKDTARRDQAIADIKRCKELPSSVQPDARAFSPAFIDFYNKVGAAPQSAARTQ
jgi:hypothetical protein